MEDVVDAAILWQRQLVGDEKGLLFDSKRTEEFIRWFGVGAVGK